MDPDRIERGAKTLGRRLKDFLGRLFGDSKLRAQGRVVKCKWPWLKESGRKLSQGRCGSRELKPQDRNLAARPWLFYGPMPLALKPGTDPGSLGTGTVVLHGVICRRIK